MSALKSPSKLLKLGVSEKKFPALILGNREWEIANFKIAQIQATQNAHNCVEKQVSFLSYIFTLK